MSYCHDILQQYHTIYKYVSFYIELIKALFQVEYSTQGSYHRPKEEQTYIFFVDFLDECEGKMPYMVVTYFIATVCTIENKVECSLEDILVFFSGADNVPPCGFQGVTPTLLFLHGNASLPTASTCELEFRLPAKYSHYAQFKDAMILGLRGNDGFGGV